MAEPLTEKEFKKFTDIYAREKGFTEMRGRFPHERLRATIEKGFASVDLNKRTGELMGLAWDAGKLWLDLSHEAPWNPTEDIAHALEFAGWAYHNADVRPLFILPEVMMFKRQRFEVWDIYCLSNNGEIGRIRQNLLSLPEAARALTKAVLEEVESE